MRHSTSIRASVCWLVGWSVTLELEIAENEKNLIKIQLVHHSCYSSFHSLSYASTVRSIGLGIGLIELGIGLIELGIGAGIHVSRHFIHYHIHLRLGG